jgi:hypothetical protein
MHRDAQCTNQTIKRVHDLLSRSAKHFVEISVVQPHWNATSHAERRSLLVFVPTVVFIASYQESLMQMRIAARFPLLLE